MLGGEWESAVSQCCLTSESLVCVCVCVCVVSVSVL